jgi:lipopolysaccharide cholinephosphotransferase
MTGKTITNETLRKLQLTDILILNEFVRICDKYELRYFLVGGTLIGAVRHKGFIPWDDDMDIGMPRVDYEKFAEISKTELNKDFFYQSPMIDKSYWRSFSRLRMNNTFLIESLDFNYCPPGYHRGIFIDIFPYDNCYNNAIIQSIQYKMLYKIRNIIALKRDKWMSPLKFYTFIKKTIYCLLSYSFLQYVRLKIMCFGSSKSNYITSWGGMYGMEKETHQIDIIFPLAKLEFEGRLYNVPGNWDAFLTHVYGDYMQLPPKEDRKFHVIDVIFDTRVENIEQNDQRIQI